MIVPAPARRRDSATLHPAFGSIARWQSRVPPGALPSLAALNEWAREAALELPDGQPVVFVAASSTALSAIDYERQVAARGEVATRAGSVHDALNAFAWLAFPRVKAALNAIHVAAANSGTPNARPRSRDAATLFDESGLIVACALPECVALWRAHAWRELFWARRADVARTMRVAAVGHGLLEKLGAPFRAITAKALVVPVEAAELPTDGCALTAALDAAAAACLRARGTSLGPADLLPLPVAALPGWDAENLGERLFDDVSVFRPRSARERANIPAQSRI